VFMQLLNHMKPLST